VSISLGLTVLRPSNHVNAAIAGSSLLPFLRPLGLYACVHRDSRSLCICVCARCLDGAFFGCASCVVAGVLRVRVIQPASAPLPGRLLLSETQNVFLSATASVDASWATQELIRHAADLFP
jgi:hypothetical protein